MREKLMVIGNPFDSDKISSLNKEEPPYFIKDILENKKTIVHVGSFKASKNHENLLKIFEIVANRISEAYLLLIGADSTGLRATIEQMAKQSKHSDRIIFLGELKNPFSIVSRGSVFVLPSIAEGMPNVLAEAMICGVPVVASDCPTGPAELLCDDVQSVIFNENGICLADYGVLIKEYPEASGTLCGNTLFRNEEFAEALVRILTDDSYREMLRNRSLKGAKKFDGDKYKKELSKLIDSILC